MSNNKTTDYNYQVTTKNNQFMAMKLTEMYCDEKRCLEYEKKVCNAEEETMKKAVAILGRELLDPLEKLTKSELTLLLLFYGIERKRHGKHVADMRELYKKLKGSNNLKTKDYNKWTPTDEEYLYSSWRRESCC